MSKKNKPLISQHEVITETTENCDILTLNRGSSLIPIAIVDRIEDRDGALHISFSRKEKSETDEIVFIDLDALEESMRIPDIYNTFYSEKVIEDLRKHVIDYFQPET